MKPKPFVFTLMPFHESFNDVWKLGIKETCEKAETYCERVDEQIYNERTLDRIYNQINKADIIVADMTGKNPNVFYEVGYAHALNKRVILIIQDVDDIPFDLKHHPFIVYNRSITTLQQELIKKVSYFINNPNSIILPNPNELEFYISGVQITENCLIMRELQKWNIGYGVQMPIDIFNGSEKTTYDDFTIGLMVGIKFYLSEGGSTTMIRQKDGKTILHLHDNKITSLYPQHWKKIFFFPSVKDPSTVNIKEMVVLRIFDKTTIKDIKFKLEIKKEQSRL